MGSHRAESRPATRRRPSDRDAETTSTPYVGRRVAGREAEPTVPLVVDDSLRRTPLVPDATVELTALTDSSATHRAAQPGKRRAVKQSGRGKGRPLFRGLPPLPVVVGVAALAVSAGGVLVSSDPALVNGDTPRMSVPNAQTGSIGSGSYDALGRVPTLSRDSDRDALEDATGTELVEEAAQQAEQRDARLGELAEQAEQEAKEINLNAWTLPIASGAYRLTATYGQAGGYWSSGYHTGLDFAAPSGTPLMAIANGVVTFAGYDGAYGNKTVITLEDGTELWYCHQTSLSVSEGDTVTSGQVIGTVGATGNVTGPHLHLEVRPGGGDPVDPYAAMVVNGVTP